MIKKYIFAVCLIGSTINAQSHDTFFSTISSWLANHKLGIAGAAFIGGGLAAHRLINVYEHKRLQRYNQTHPVNSVIKTSSEAQDLINSKLKKGYEILGTTRNLNDATLEFRKVNLLGKFLDDKIQFGGTNNQSIEFESYMDAENNDPRMRVYVKEGETVFNNPNIIVTTHERKLESIGYANWIRNVSIGIGILDICGEIFRPRS